MNLLRQVLLQLLPLLLASWSSGGWATPSAWLDRTVIDEGEILRLGIEIEGDVPGDPDTDPLLPFFEIEGIANGHRQIRAQTGFVNFTTWTITLRPRQAGRLEIPSLRIAGQATPPLLVDVRPTQGAGSQGEVFIRSSVDTPAPWVQSMVLLTVRVYYDLPLADGELTIGDIPDALTQQLKGDQLTVETLDGKRYKVVERRLALFPQKPGRLTIPAPILDARTPLGTHPAELDFSRLDNNPLQAGSGDFDSFVTASRPLRIEGEALSLEVKPPPAGYSGSHWLPAREMELEESIEHPATTIHAGEPVTRTITLRARGLKAEQLPAPFSNGSSREGIYRDKPRRHNTTADDDIIATLTQRIVHVPRHAGRRLTLPPIEIVWWDVAANQPRTARLPAHHFEVAAAAQSPAATETAPAKQTAATPKTTPASRHDTATWLWPSVTTGLTLLWLLTLLLWWSDRRLRPHLRQKALAARRRFARKRFHQACRENLPKPARQYLLQWAASHWPDDPPPGLDALAERIADPALTTLLRQLDAAIWSDGKKAWRGRKLSARLKKLPKTETPERQRNPLSALYPET